MQCLNCPKRLIKKQKYFCSHDCHNLFRRENRICPCGKAADRKMVYCDSCISTRVYNRCKTFESAKTDSVRKKFLILERGYRCEGCGLSKWRGKDIPITLEHKNGNSDNNTKENLELLCLNCHGQTSTYGRRNTKNAHSLRNRLRRARYTRGVSVKKVEPPPGVEPESAIYETAVLASEL